MEAARANQISKLLIDRFCHGGDTETISLFVVCDRERHMAFKTDLVRESEEQSATARTRRTFLTCSFFKLLIFVKARLDAVAVRRQSPRLSSSI